ncbi:hypothetical protein RhiirA5_435100 [Rhizophagus irregularis]|uniref:Uncharacterized protein n=1 Tax=Rhizophagus irregularis TaxID=588596 RepID=A0A2N0NNX5_9GLOM|nr:hypothetical protein RhiirA5_435100 [Rhizophagus irregularis]
MCSKRNNLRPWFQANSSQAAFSAQKSLKIRNSIKGKIPEIRISLRNNKANGVVVASPAFFRKTENMATCCANNFFGPRRAAISLTIEHACSSTNWEEADKENQTPKKRNEVFKAKEEREREVTVTKEENSAVMERRSSIPDFEEAIRVESSINVKCEMGKECCSNSSGK